MMYARTSLELSSACFKSNATKEGDLYCHLEIRFVAKSIMYTAMHCC